MAKLQIQRRQKRRQFSIYVSEEFVKKVDALAKREKCTRGQVLEAIVANLK